MRIDDYLAALDDALRGLGVLVVSWTVQREIDASLGVGWLKGQINFVDGSRLQFSEQLPIDRKKYRLHYMDADDRLLIRWDSAPHHKDMSTFPFHKHTPQGVEEHEAITLLAALAEIAQSLST